jgi:GNAT superfamily N-acetyltransferase
MKIVKLNEGLERYFWKYVYSDPLDNYFFIYDYKQHRALSEFHLVISESEEILGLSLNFNCHVLQLRGTEAAISLMLDKLDIGNAYLQVPVEYEKVALSKHPSFSSKVIITLMSFTKGHENIRISMTPEKLSVEDSAEIFNLLNQTNLALWHRTVEEVKSRFEDSLWVGARESGKLVSVGAVRLNDYGSLIGPIVTLEPYRNKGYATTIVSVLVREALKISSTPVISVKSDNVPAISIYTSIGFKPYKSYLYLFS